MKKDYIKVSEENEGTDESEFIERHWTNIWKDRRIAGAEHGLSRREEYQIIRPYVMALPLGARILDAGCGLGEWTLFFSQQGYDAVGLDVSETTIARLKSCFPEQQFVHGDLRNTMFRDGSFDACFSWGAFEHFEEGMADCIIEAGRLLKPGGGLFISVPFHNWRHIFRDARPLDRWDHEYDRIVGYSRPQRFYQWRFTRPELRRELELRGFQVHAICPISKDTGVGRWLQWEARLFRSGTLPFRAARRFFATILPAAFISHMILAVASKRA